MAAPVPPGGRVPATIEPSVARTILVEGVVQGVGFRPFVWRLATELGLAGRVRNAAGRVEVEAAGPVAALDAFARRLRTDAPPRARVERVTVAPLDPGAATDLPIPFAIDESVSAAATDRLFPPDIATCDDCLRELFDPADRRYRYPFTNCTNCGPRATIIDELPYDRAQTTMRAFPLCDACDAEYRNPADRRFHAEPVACATCGPRLSWRPTGAPAPIAEGDDALAAAVAGLLDGAVVAVKGLGGYHLACDATDDAAVRRLRDRKRRWAKPFAIMVRDVAAARALCRVGALERRLLEGPARPIVLLEARRDGEPALAPSVANGNRRLGVFLPYTPLHHLLLEAVGRPLVLTSGNLTDEPLATDDADALARLSGLADGFLAHDREIRARYDDSVTRVVARRESVVRRARGYAPEPMPLPVATPVPLLAVGAELKHTFTLARGGRAHVAPHNGDLEDLATHRAFTDGLAHLSRLLALEPEVVVHDLHPEYLSTKYALERFPAGKRVAVQHHHAHVASCAAEHGITRSVPGRGLRRPGHGRRRHVLGRRGPPRGPALVPAHRAVRAGADARRGARRQEAVPHGAGLPPGRGGGRRRRGHRRQSGRTGRPVPGPPRPARARARAHAGRPLAQRPGGVVGGAAVRRGGGAARDPRRGGVRGTGGDRPGAGGRRPRRGRCSRTGWRAWTGCWSTTRGRRWRRCWRRAAPAGRRVRWRPRSRPRSHR